MVKISYTALRKIAPTHTAGNPYELNFEVTVNNEVTNFLKDTSVSLDGTEEVVYHSDNETYVISANYIDNTDIDFWKEFMHSVNRGESFQWFPDNVNSITVVMVTKDYSPVRTNNVSGEFTFNLTFKREV